MLLLEVKTAIHRPENQGAERICPCSAGQSTKLEKARKPRVPVITDGSTKVLHGVTMAKHDAKLTETHSIEEAETRHKTKQGKRRRAG